MEKLSVSIQGRESLELAFDARGELVKMNGKGSLAFLRELESLRLKFTTKDLFKSQSVEIKDQVLAKLFGVLSKKLTGQWDPPYREERLCHCRAVSTKEVIDSICSGSDTCEKVGRACSAGTSCGNCQTDITSLLAYL